MNHISFFRASSETAAKSIISNTLNLRPKNVNLINAYSLAAAEESCDYESYSSPTSLNLYDGFLVGMVLGIFSNSRSNVTTRGVDILRYVFKLDEKSELKHFFICGSIEIKEKLLAVLSVQNPNAKICGFWIPSPNFNLLEFDQEISDLFKTALPNVVWVGLGTPKQDKLSSFLVNEIDCTTIGVGAAFEFVSGLKKECPYFLRKLRLEWFYRLSQEPKRLWQRYTVDMYFFIKSILRNKFTEL